jgi:hypothetical protein
MTTTATTTHADAAPTTTPPELTPAGSSTLTTTGRTTTTRKRGHYAAIPNEIADVYGPRIGAVAGFVYYLLCHHARAGKCWPTVETLARKGRISEKTVKRKLRVLEKEGLIEIDVGGGEAVKRNGKMTRASVYTLKPIGPPKGDTVTPSKGDTVTPLRGTQLPPNNTYTNKTHHQQAKHPPKIATGGPVFGGGGADSNLTQDAENIMRAFAACELKRYPHTLALADRIAGYPHAPDVIEAEYAAVKGKSRNAAGALYSRLNNMTPADWAARAPKARPVVRMKEIHE